MRSIIQLKSHRMYHAYYINSDNTSLNLVYNKYEGFRLYKRGDTELVKWHSFKYKYAFYFDGENFIDYLIEINFDCETNIIEYRL